MDRKRQRKLEKKRARQKKREFRELSRTTTEPLAYHGRKFKTEELVPFILKAESGILEAFAVSDRRLTDHDVARTLKSLIEGNRRNTLPSPEDAARAEGTIDDFMMWRIRQNWDDVLKTEPHPGRDKLVGVLRTILGSIETWGSLDPQSRGYLNYVEDFLGQMGIFVEQVDPRAAAIQPPEGDRAFTLRGDWD